MSLTVDLPAGCMPGDLLLLSVAGKFAGMSLTLSPHEWTRIRQTTRSSLRQDVFYRFYDPSDAGSVVATTSWYTPLTATIQCFSNVDRAAPIRYAGTATGYAVPFVAGSLPAVLQPQEADASGLLVQLIAAENDQWRAATFGLASFSDKVHSIAAPGVLYQTVAQGAALRRGNTPAMSAAPHVWCSAFGYWVQTAIELEPAP